MGGPQGGLEDFSVTHSDAFARRFVDKIACLRTAFPEIWDSFLFTWPEDVDRIFGL